MSAALPEHLGPQGDPAALPMLCSQKPSFAKVVDQEVQIFPTLPKEKPASASMALFNGQVALYPP